MFVFVVLFALVQTGCEKGDGDADCGYGKIYITQATIADGNYSVPAGGGKDTYNFVVENGKLNIYLGVLRSGKISDAPGFTVGVAVSQTMTDAAASGANTIAMPSSLYTLPGKVTVPSGNNSAVFFLSVDVDVLMDGTYDGKKLVLALTIGAPTNFELNDADTSVVVILDVDAMRAILFPKS